MIEVWKPIKEYEKLYEVSSLGRVRNVKTQYVLKPCIMSGKYPWITLKHIMGARKIFVHKLVCEAFHGLRPNGYQCNHKDGNKENNKAINLEWVTASENMKHAYINGFINVGAGNDHWSKQLGNRTHPCKKKYELISPKGKKYIITGVKECCSMLKVSRGTFYNSINGNYNMGNGWMCNRIN